MMWSVTSTLLAPFLAFNALVALVLLANLRSSTVNLDDADDDDTVDCDHIENINSACSTPVIKIRRGFRSSVCSADADGDVEDGDEECDTSPIVSPMSSKRDRRPLSPLPPLPERYLDVSHTLDVSQNLDVSHDKSNDEVEGEGEEGETSPILPSARKAFARGTLPPHERYLDGSHNRGDDSHDSHDSDLGRDFGSGVVGEDGRAKDEKAAATIVASAGPTAPAV
eukprot:1187712-Prorocentrum_minimum.AAC.1